MTASEAAKLYREAKSRPGAHLEGDEAEFYYWLSDVEGTTPVRCHVYAVDAADVPEDVRKRLQALT